MVQRMVQISCVAPLDFVCMHHSNRHTQGATKRQYETRHKPLSPPGSRIGPVATRGLKKSTLLWPRIYPVVNIYITMKKHMFSAENGKTHYDSMTIFNGKLLVYQKVNPIESRFNPIKSP